MPDAAPLAYATEGAHPGGRAAAGSTPGSRPACTTPPAASTRAVRGWAPAAPSRPAPTLHPAFAAAVVAEAAAAGAERVLEAGPGDGSLAAALVAAGLEVVLLERAAGMRALQRERLGDTVRWIDDVAEVGAVRGADGGERAARRAAVPAVRRRGRGVRRPRRATAGSRPSRRRRREPRGRSSGPALRAARCAASRGALHRGRLLLIDYAAAPGDPRDPVRTYIGGQHGGDPLQAPGHAGHHGRRRLRRGARDPGRCRPRARGGRAAGGLAAAPRHRCRRRCRAAPTTAGGWRACSTRRCRSTCSSPTAPSPRTHEGPGSCRALRSTNVGVEP